MQHGGGRPFVLDMNTKGRDGQLAAAAVLALTWAQGQSCSHCPHLTPPLPLTLSCGSSSASGPTLSWGTEHMVVPAPTWPGSSGTAPALGPVPTQSWGWNCQHCNHCCLPRWELEPQCTPCLGLQRGLPRGISDGWGQVQGGACTRWQG